MPSIIAKSKNEIVKRSVVKYFDTQNNEVKFTTGQGGYIYDEIGREYLDCVLGYGPVVLGHTNETFIEALKEGLTKGIHLPGFTTAHDNYIEKLVNYSGLRSEIAPVFMKTSSEANTGAIRIATQKTGRKGVLRCGFTGWHDVQYASSPSWHLPPPHRLPIRNAEVMRGVSNDELVYNWISLEIQELSTLLKSKGDNIACLIIDAFQHSFVQKALLEEAIKLCKAYGILIALDETKTAGRVSPLGFAGAQEDLWDMLILGKAIGNGAPLSLLIAKEEFREQALKAQIGGTHSKELLSVKCALATLDIMRSSNGYETLALAGSKIAEVFNQCANTAGLEHIVRLEPVFGGSILDIRFHHRLYNDPKMLRYLQSILLENGILHLVGHPSFVSLAHHEIKVNTLEQKFYDSLTIWLARYKDALLGQ